MILPSAVGLFVSALADGNSTCMTSIIRVVVLLKIDPADLMCRAFFMVLYTKQHWCMSNQLISDTSTLPQLWSCVEVSFGVISACLPSLTTLFLALLGKKPSSSRRHSVSLGRSRIGRRGNAEFSRVMDTTDDGGYSQSFQLAKYRADSNGVTEGGGNPGSILISSRVDHTTSTDSMEEPALEDVGAAVDASTWNV